MKWIKLLSQNNRRLAIQLSTESEVWTKVLNETLVRKPILLLYRSRKDNSFVLIDGWRNTFIVNSDVGKAFEVNGWLDKQQHPYKSTS